jgi:flagellar biosynthesis/type III secretory pathway protein FliH
LPVAEKTLFKNDARFTHSGDPDGRRALALVKPEGALFEPKPGDHRFKGAEQIPEKGARQPFKPGLPEKEISLPDPLVQQAIARTLAGVSSKGFQLLSPKTMAQVTEISKTAPRSKAEEREAAEAKTAKEAKGAKEAQNALAAQELKAAKPHATEAGQKPASALAEDAEAEETAAVAEARETAEASEAAATEEAATAEAFKAVASTDPSIADAETEAIANAEASTPEALPDQGLPAVDGEPSAALAPATPAGLIPDGMQLVLAADIQQMFDEAFAQGQEAAMQEAEARMQEAAAAIEQERQAIEDAAYQRGYDEGHAKAEASVRDELQAEVELAAEDLRDLTARMAESARDTDNFYAPLLKLAMHLAEQLVRGELSMSSKAIERLIQTALDEFNQDPNASVLIKLNPEDLARLKTRDAQLPKNMVLRSDPLLTMGSVRVQMNGALIEDLIEHRGRALWESLTSGLDVGAPPPSFLQNVALIKEAFDGVDAVIEEPSLSATGESLREPHGAARPDVDLPNESDAR